ncbi:MAG: methyltransferase domain-containing protein [Candidatus Latescibacteria bacterium]|nr:methyltransferase domain-containing protein [Candidatus Latescibacterota bacterium]
MGDEKVKAAREEPDPDSYIQNLVVSDPLQESAFRKAIQILELLPGSRGLDAGCGIGLQALMLAEAVGPGGHVTGLDVSPELLRYAESKIEKSGMAARISFQRGDVSRLPFDDDTFDWVWSANCVGYETIEPLPLVKELARVVRPGGSVAILAWSSQQLLPGYPRLEARLNATCSGIAPFIQGRKPELHFLRALGWYRKAGLENTVARTFVDDVCAPLSEDIRSALISLFSMRWVDVESELTPEDREEYKRLCRPESPDFILDHPDYYAFFIYSMFHGKVTE